VPIDYLPLRPNVNVIKRIGVSSPTFLMEIGSSWRPHPLCTLASPGPKGGAAAMQRKHMKDSPD
jgi:hypothetical protein